MGEDAPGPEVTCPPLSEEKERGNGGRVSVRGYWKERGLTLAYKVNK